MLLLMANAGLVRRTADLAPSASRRLVGLALDGLRAEAATAAAPVARRACGAGGDDRARPLVRLRCPGATGRRRSLTGPLRGGGPLRYGRPTGVTSGRSVVASAPALGAGDREFESPRPDPATRRLPTRSPIAEEHSTTVKSAVETLTPTRVRLTVEVPFEELKPSLDAAYKRIAAQVTSPASARARCRPRSSTSASAAARSSTRRSTTHLPQAYDAAVRRARGQAARPARGRRHRVRGRRRPEVHRRGRRPSRDRRCRTTTASRSGRRRRRSPTSDVDEQVDGLRDRFATLTHGRARRRRRRLRHDRPRRDARRRGDRGRAPPPACPTRSAAASCSTASTRPSSGSPPARRATFAHPLQAGEYAGQDVDVTVTVTGGQGARAARRSTTTSPSWPASSTPSTSCAPTCARRLEPRQAAQQGVAGPRQGRSRRCSPRSTSRCPRALVEAAGRPTHFDDGHGDDDHRAEFETQAREEPRPRSSSSTRSPRRRSCRSTRASSSEYLVRQAPRYGMTPDAVRPGARRGRPGARGRRRGRPRPRRSPSCSSTPIVTDASGRRRSTSEALDATRPTAVTAEGHDDDHEGHDHARRPRALPPSANTPASPDGRGVSSR